MSAWGGWKKVRNFCQDGQSASRNPTWWHPGHNIKRQLVCRQSSGLVFWSTTFWFRLQYPVHFIVFFSLPTQMQGPYVTLKQAIAGFFKFLFCHFWHHSAFDGIYSLKQFATNHKTIPLHSHSFLWRSLSRRCLILKWRAGSDKRMLYLYV